MIWWIEKDGKPVQVTGDEFSVWFSTADRTVWKSRFPDVEVSTVFLGIDHGFCFMKEDSEDAPIVYETMVFSRGDYEEMNEYTRRYATREAAMHGHEQILMMMALEDNRPDFVEPPIEEQISRFQMLMDDDENG